MTPAGLESPLAKRVRKGYVLVAINDTVITKKKHSEVKRLLQSSMNRRRTLLFRDGSVHYSNKDVKGTSSKSDSSHVDIEVRTARLNRETSKTFAEFELLVSLRVRSKLGHAINQWSLWKRYSDMSGLDSRMRAQYGWQMEKIKFPPKKTFGNLDPVFIEKRREGLDFYFHEILGLSDVADFKKHFSSQDLKQFIQYDANKEVKITKQKTDKRKSEQSGEEKTSSKSSSSSSSSSSSRSSSSRSKKSSRPRSSRRRSRATRETGSSSNNDKQESIGEEPLALMPPEEPQPTDNQLGPEYDPFLRMQKAGVPEGAIRQKMMVSGVDPGAMFGGGGGGGVGGVGGGGGRPPPPRGGRPPPNVSIKATRPPPLPTKKKSSSSTPSSGARGGLLAAIRGGSMLKKTKTKEPPPVGQKPAAPANPMMAAILARRKRVEQ